MPPPYEVESMTEFTVTDGVGVMATTKAQGNGTQVAVPTRPEVVERPSEFLPSIWKSSPFGMMRRMMEDMDRMFEDWGVGRTLFGKFEEPAMMRQAMWTPVVEVFEKGNKFIVQADLPGMKKEDITLEVDESKLILKGERRSKHEEKREGYFRSERSYGSFFRSIPLPEGVTTKDIVAHFKDGVLEIEMPAPEKPKKTNVGKIEIQ